MIWFRELIQRICDSVVTFFGLVPWVNVYTVNRAYGGTEDGGWYYRKYTCQQSKQTWFLAADALQCQLQRKFEGLSWGVLSSETDGQEIVVLIEQRKAGQSALSRPAYAPHVVVEKPDRAKLEAYAKEKSARMMKPDPQMYKRKWSTYAVVPYSTSSKSHKHSSKQKTCSRCKGTGKTRYKHVQNGVCFMCKGSGKVRNYRYRTS